HWFAIPARAPARRKPPDRLHVQAGFLVVGDRRRNGRQRIVHRSTDQRVPRLRGDDRGGRFRRRTRLIRLVPRETPSNAYPSLPILARDIPPLPAAVFLSLRAASGP